MAVVRNLQFIFLMNSMLLFPCLRLLLNGTHPPPQDVLKFNVDAAVDLNRGRAAIAVVVRDYSGAMLVIVLFGLKLKQWRRQFALHFPWV